MSDPYLSGNSEFHPDTAWLPECQDTLSHRNSGRSDWATIETFYPQLQVPTGDITEVNPGPSSLPLALTHIQVHEPHANSGVLSAPYFYLVDEHGSRVQPDNGARSILYQGDKLIDLGRPTQDRILARGAADGDRLCLYDLDVGQLGCKLVTLYNEQLTLWSYPDWQPEITVSPVTSRTIDISVANVPSGLPLHAKLYPINDPATDVIVLTDTTSSYTGSFNTDEPALNGYIQVWVDESEPRRESVTNYTIGGAPGYQRGGGGYQRGGGGYQRGGGASAVSTDGQAILFGEGLVFGEGEFVALQTATVLPNVPAWATVAGDAYRLVMSDAAPDLTGSSLSVSYLEREVPADEEIWLKLYYWNGTTWQPLQTTLDTYHNFASGAVQGEGLYVLMSSIELPIYGPGWDSFGYPIQETLPVSVALSSINGSYTMVYGRNPEDEDEWKVYGPDAPDHVNDLKVLEYGHSYWIYLTESVDLRLQGRAAANASATDSIPRPPATYYGTIATGPGFEPAMGTEVTAWVNGNLCGKSKSVEWNEQVVYSINVIASGDGNSQGCGLAGDLIAYRYLPFLRCFPRYGLRRNVEADPSRRLSGSLNSGDYAHGGLLVVVHR